MGIEIDTPNAEKLQITYEDSYDDDGECDEKKDKEKREEFAKDLHNYCKKIIQRFIDDVFAEEFMDNLEELSIENWDNFEDYGVKIKLLD